MKYVLFIGFALLCWAHEVRAHERSESTSHWILDNGELHGIVTARAREVTRLTVPGDSYASLTQIFSAHVQRSIAASVDGIPCTLRESPSSLESEPGYLRVDVRMHCVPGERLTLKLELFLGVAPSHHHFLYVESVTANGREAILSTSVRAALLELHPAAVGETRFLQFVGMGIEHIATGFDHLAFLLALLISARSARQVLAIVTGFTLGHSLTLSLAALGILQANRGAVECLIGLTIALAAARNLVRGERESRIAALVAFAVTTSMLLIPADLRPDLPAGLIIAVAVTAGSAIWLAGTGAGPLPDTPHPHGALPQGPCPEEPSPGTSRATAAMGLAMAFGWVHGLGFASALQDLQLPRSRLVPTLLGFNVGVEIGQLLIVLTAVVLLKTMARIAPAATILPASRRRGLPATVASAVLLAIGLALFLTRAA